MKCKRLGAWHQAVVGEEYLQLKKTTVNNKHIMDCDAQLGYSRQPLVFWGFWSAKQVTLTQFLLCDQSSLIGLCMQDYKSLCAAVTICATLVNIQTHTKTAFDQLIWKAQPAELKTPKDTTQWNGDHQPLDRMAHNERMNCQSLGVHISHINKICEIVWEKQVLKSRQRYGRSMFICTLCAERYQHSNSPPADPPAVRSPMFGTLRDWRSVCCNRSGFML